MTEVTNELMYEVLKAIQSQLVNVNDTLADHTDQFLRVRNDINELRKDDLRIESMQAKMESRLERIERRLNLVDA